MQPLYILSTILFSLVLLIQVSIISGLLFGLGSIATWLTSYQALSAIIWAKGSKRIVIFLAQTALCIIFFWVLIKSQTEVGILGVSISCKNYGILSVIMGCVCAFTHRPSDEEIDLVSQKDF